MPMSDLLLHRETTCCFSGHRNRDLPFEGVRTRLGMRNLVSSLCLEIENAVKEGYDTFISGMADGIDLICAEKVHELIEYGKKLRLVCALPYGGQIREMTSRRDIYIYRILVARYPCITVSLGYYRGCYKERNRFMVEHSSKLIAVMRSKTGGSGTLQTVRMAERAGLDTHIIRLDGNNPMYFLGDRE